MYVHVCMYAFIWMYVHMKVFLFVCNLYVMHVHIHADCEVVFKCMYVGIYKHLCLCIYVEMEWQCGLGRIEIERKGR